MATLTETSNFDTTVNEILVTDAVLGGTVGTQPANASAQNLTNRTRWLYNAVSTILSTMATLVSPVFSGTPTVPAVAAGDNSLIIANTAFVQKATKGVAFVPVTGGNVTLTPAQFGCGIIELSGTLTSNLIVIFPDVNTPSPSLQTGLWAVAAYVVFAGHTVTLKTSGGSGPVISQGDGLELSVYSDGVNLFPQTSWFNGVALSGVPTTPTAAPGNNSTQVASTAYADAGLALKANLASPALSGAPTAPTAAAHTNSTQLATTAYTDAAVATAGVVHVFRTGLIGGWGGGQIGAGAYAHGLGGIPDFVQLRAKCIVAGGGGNYSVGQYINITGCDYTGGTPPTAHNNGSSIASDATNVTGIIGDQGCAGADFFGGYDFTLTSTYWQLEIVAVRFS